MVRNYGVLFLSSFYFFSVVEHGRSLEVIWGMPEFAIKEGQNANK